MVKLPNFVNNHACDTTFVLVDATSHAASNGAYLDAKIFISTRIGFDTNSVCDAILLLDEHIRDSGSSTP